MLAAVLLMFSRLPNLLWEIRHGQKINKKDKPKGFLYQAAFIASWLALVVLWWSLYSLYS